MAKELPVHVYATKMTPDAKLELARSSTTPFGTLPLAANRGGMPPKERILLLMLETGGGHSAPAFAIKEALERLYPTRFDVQVMDLAVRSGALNANRQIKGAWDFALAHPWAARLSYFFVETLRPLARLYLSVMVPELIKRGTALLRNNPPTAILSTHYLCTDVALRARRALGNSYPVMQLVTDPWDAFRWWALEDVDLQFVASERAKNMLVARGVTVDNVRIVPFPVARRFLEPCRSSVEILSILGLCADRPTVLFTLGSQGIGKTWNWMREICARNLRCNLVIVTGKNNRARERLVSCTQSSVDTRVAVVGFVDNVHELLSVADVVVGKAGASTTMEALAMATPILFVACAGPHEKPNIDFCLKHGVGWYSRSRVEFITCLERLLTGNELREASERARNLTLQLGPDELAHIVARVVPEVTLPSFNLPLMAVPSRRSRNRVE
jgi:UDP-N-acetylglucosamine:LPS N-acetylglucosamine transferase